MTQRPLRRNGRGASRTKTDTEALFRLAVEAAPSAMIMVDHLGKIVLVNSQTEKLFGYARSELLGKKIEILVPSASRKKHLADRSKFLAHPETRSMGAGRDLFGVRKDKTAVPVEIGLNPVHTSEGLFVMASVIDISERKKLEKKVAHNEALAAVGKMVAAVSHEIRNPLGSIVLGAKALARGGLSEQDSSQVLSILKSESERLSRTLNDFLEFSRPREPKLQPGDLNGAAREVLAAVKSDQALVGRIAVRESLSRSLPSVNFDADQIRQVLWNIVRNGLEAMEGKGRLEVRTEAREREAIIHVQDTGTGISSQDIEKIFTPFRTTKPKGMGLGLSISRNIVLSHGGDIRIESRPGKGTRFSIVLPLP